MSGFKAGIFLALIHFAFAEPHNLTVKPGDDIKLLCEHPNRTIPSLLVWSRPDLIGEGYVYFYRGDGSSKNYQLPSYRGRVELRVPHMKDGNMSVVLKNVTRNDTGTYECRIKRTTSELTKQSDPELISTINLKVEDSGRTAGSTKDGGTEDGNGRGHVGLVFLLVPVCVVFVPVMVRWCKRKITNTGGAACQTKILNVV